MGGPDGIINYTQVVWGNARLSPSGQITCQHGAEECKMNILQVRYWRTPLLVRGVGCWTLSLRADISPFACTPQDCAVAHAKGNVSQFIPFIHCLEKFGTQQGQHVSTCAKEWGYDLAALNTCATGPEGKSLILAAAKATPADHQYVPWTTVNGKNICLDSDPPATPCYLLLKSVCDAYVPPAGGSKPAACSSERASLADW